MRNNNKKQKIYAFTIIEVLIVMSIIGVITAILLVNINLKSHIKKGDSLMAFKAIQSVDDALGQIRNTETEVVPTGLLMIKNASGNYEYAILSTNGGGALANTTELVGMVGDYMKKDGDVINFCNFTSACSNSGIKGFKLPGGFYVGFEKFESAQDCPSFRMPNNPDTEIKPAIDLNGNTKQCWGKLHVDTNGTGSPDALGEDYFVFGLDEFGVVTKGKEDNKKTYGKYVEESNQCQINSENFDCDSEGITCSVHTQGAECYRTN